MSDQTPMGPMSWVLTDEDLEHLIEELSAAELVVFDLETTGLQEYATTGGQQNGGVAARIVMAAFTVQNEAVAEPTSYVLPLSHPQSPWLGHWRAVMRRAAQAIKDSQVPVANQNIKFDCRWIYAHTNVDLTQQIMWDTQISSHLLDETRSTRLKERAPETFNVPAWDDIDLAYPGAAEEADLYALGEYAARDTYWTWRLMKQHREEMYLEGGSRPEFSEEIINARLGNLAVWTAMPMVRSLTAIEQRGFALDVPWVQEQLELHEQGARRSLEKMAERYGMDRDKASGAATSHWFRDWTQAATEAGDLEVISLTPSGNPQWSKGNLVRLANRGSEVAQLVLDQRSHEKYAQYLRSWLTSVTSRGLVHSTYHAGRVVTGRLSSTDPNMQQVTKELRPAFVPRPGYVIADIDYSQIELRVAAFISGSEPMIEAFRRGDDLHTLLAAQITGKDPEEVTPQERQAGKSANFGLLYMMGPFGFREYAETAYGVSFTMDEASMVHKTFFDTWEGMRQWHAESIAKAERDGYVTSPIGRVRRLPDIQGADERKAAHAQRNSVNSPVQGFASDLMQMAAASIGGFMPGMSPVQGAHLVATVHDSIVVEVLEKDAVEITRKCMDRMVRLNEVLRRLDCDLTVPLVAEATLGTRWGWDDVDTIQL